MTPIVWMTKNHVAANIILLLIFIGGLIVGPNIPQEVFPDIELEFVFVTVVYPGAGPTEVEKALCVPLEQAVFNHDDVIDTTCIANENLAFLTLGITKGSNLDTVVQEIRNEVQAIQNFPSGAELPTVTKVTRFRQIIGAMVAGDVSEKALYDLARRIEEELGELNEVSKVTLEGIKETELSIEVQPEVLAHHGLTLESLALIIRTASLDLPAGSLQTDRGSMLIRSVSKRVNPEEFAQVIIKTKNSGAVIRLGEIAKIQMRVANQDDFLLYDGKRAVFIRVFQKDDYTPEETAIAIKKYMDQKSLELPESIHFEVWSDYSEVFNDRFNLLLRNAAIGLVLVFIVLSIFLEIHLAFWVILGIPISFIGSLILISPMGVTINMISLFAFILVLGIVVDDAIVIGENVYQKIEAGKGHLEAAIEGTKEMAPAVTFAVLTTLVAFSPLLFIQGVMGSFLMAIPLIVMSVLVVSLFEAIFILPSHLSSPTRDYSWAPFRLLQTIRGYSDQWIKGFTKNQFTRTLNLALDYRYSTVTLGVVILIICVALMVNGFLPVKFFPSIEGDQISLTVELPTGYPADKSKEILQELEEVGIATLAEIDREKGEGKSSFKHVYTSYTPYAGALGATAVVQIRLKGASERSISSFEFGRRWRKAIHDTPEILNLSLKSRGMHFGNDVQLNLSHNDPVILAKAVEESKAWVAKFEGVVDIDDSERAGKKELQFHLSNQARSMGITPLSFGNSLRNAFFGVKVLTFQKDKQEIDVQLHYPKAVGSDLANLEHLRIQGPQGGEITLAEAAHVQESQEPISIRREDRQRVVLVTANFEAAVKNPDTISDAITKQWIPELKEKYPSLHVTEGGAQEERMKSMGSLLLSFLFAMFFIYALLAIFFRSYYQPFVVMLAIPFGIAGAAIGHMLLGYPLSFMSIFGLVGLSGVVVNDSLILIDAVNHHGKKESDLITALIESAQIRFRPIIMTSITTFCGLMPMLLETSRQAKFMVPMAISLGVGIMFATLITLILIPAFYFIGQDIKEWQQARKGTA